MMETKLHILSTIPVMVFSKFLLDRPIARLLLVAFLLTCGASMLAACGAASTPAPAPNEATSSAPEGSAVDTTTKVATSPAPEGTAVDTTPTPVASFEVNSVADAVDVSPGDGVCDDGAGNCTLRAAIMEANNLDGAVAITLPAGT